MISFHNIPQATSIISRSEMMATSAHQKDSSISLLFGT